MEVTIEAYSDIIYVKVGKQIVGKFTSLNDALECARSEILSRYQYFEKSKKED
jgi:hypothetical protein